MCISFRIDSTIARMAMGLRCEGFSALVAFACCLFTPSVNAGDLCRDPVGRLVSIEGKVDIQDRGGSRRAAQRDSPLCEGDTIRVGDRSRAALRLMNNAVLRIDQNTTIRLVNITGGTERRSWIELVSGAIESFNHKPWLLRVTTPHLKGDIDGTEFYAQVEAKPDISHTIHPSPE